MKLSYRDLVLLIGILVAAVIALTTWKYGDHQPKTHIVQPQVDYNTLNSTTSMVIDQLVQKDSLHRSCVQ